MTVTEGTEAAGESAAGRDGPAICLEHVRFGYGGNPVVEDADFDIFPGESVCVVGPNGGGKTTLLKLMLGLLTPDSGRIRILGDAPRKARRRVGYVPQDIRFDPYFPITALEVVRMGRLTGRSLGFHTRRDTERAEAALERLGLRECARVPFPRLSGGQRQGVLIARALAGEVSLLLLDEPTAHVDVAAEDRLLENLRSLERELTLVTVSHDLTFVTRSVPKVVCVNRTVHVHPTTELTEGRIRELYGRDVRLVTHEDEHSDSHTGHRHQ